MSGDSHTIHAIATWAILGTAGVTFVSLLVITAPYGRHIRTGWGPTIPSRLGWITMESPAMLGFAAIYLLGDHRLDTAPLALLGLWQIHYVHRTVIFPLRMRASHRRMPVVIALLGVSFNSLNAYINARFISHIGGYDASWLSDPRFVIGAALFGIGLLINIRADSTLRNLRAPGESGYKIPRGGLFEYVSCPNYLGEIIEWIGWAIATWSLAGVSFAVYTAANLVPRALDHHRWYRAKFDDYPARRRAIIPFVL